MEQECLRCVNDAQAASAKPQTQINVLVSGEIMRVKAADVLEKRLASHEAGTGNRGNFARANQTAGIAVPVDRKPAHGVVGRTPHPESDAGMLDSLVFIREQGASGADVSLPGIKGEMLEPTFAHDFRIVIKENQEIAGRGRGSFVVRL